MRPRFTDEEFRGWSEWLAEEYGLCFGPEKREILRSRLEPRRAALGVEAYADLLFHVRFHPERAEECEALLPHLTNNETYFCREPGSLAVIRDEVLPAIRREVGPGGEIRILSAACSTGEEAYTLAILAREAGGSDPGSGRVRITGMDLDPRALEVAREGRYGSHAFRATDEPFRARWFEACGEGWRVRPELRENVAFVRGNLVGTGWWEALPRQHLVLCRNVLIYFDEQALRRAAEGLTRVLAPGGRLFLGHAETLRRVATELEVERRSGAIFYTAPAGDR
jgi:chemotaxis protein methyltransferase CheR